MGRSILVVDDEPAILDVVAEALELHSCVVQRARDGIEAWDLLSLYTPDVIVSDLRMPRSDGRALFDRLKESEKSSIPFIFMSATPESVIDVGAFAVIRKPFSFDSLLIIVETAINEK